MSRARLALLARDGAARAGELTVRGKTLATPAFLPVGTYGAVKGVPPELLPPIGSRMLLANACHLADRPGAETVARLGGLHRFMGWDGLLLTDSGGFQVFSLASLSRLDEDGVTFRSPVDGRALRLDAERSVDDQQLLDADIAMAFDDCPPWPSPRARVEASVARTTRWAERALARQRERDRLQQSLFGIVQGGLDDELRERSAAAITALPFDGFALGGLSVGEGSARLHPAVSRFAPLLPEDRPRYLMGVGRPRDVLAAIAAGIDVFDCVWPTRNARHGSVLVAEGSLSLRLAALAGRDAPIDEACDCPTCRRWSLGALRHLTLHGDPLAGTLASLHNLRFLHRLVQRARDAILAGRFAEFREREAG